MSVDAKARVTLPAVFRKQLVDGDKKTIYLVPLNGCVNGFTPERFEEYVNGLFEYGDNHFDPRNRDDVRLKRGLWARAVEVDIDSAGRVALGKLDASKAGTREKLGLLDDVTVEEVERRLDLPVQIVDEPGRDLVLAVLNETNELTHKRRIMYEQSDCSNSGPSECGQVDPV